MDAAFKFSLIVCCFVGGISFAEEIAPPVEADKNKPDNSVRNVRERSNGEKTPIDQNENKPDLAITQNIRKAIIADKTLSTYAHNIKIITQDGVVNLKGPVRSEEERLSVEAKAIAVAGRLNVQSQLAVAPATASAPAEPAIEEVAVPVKADNSGRNVRERSDTEKSALDQNENKADLEITRKIRQSIVTDRTLSTYAHNIKIMTQDGSVTLKGPVRTAEEKIAVEAKALEVAGQGKVVSQIEVAAKETK